jgi:DNA-binding response OmpR family regulator
MRMLVVEDRADTRAALSLLLKLHGHEVETAASVETGLTRLLRGGIEVVISDWELGDGTGGAMLERAERGALTDVAVIVFSSSRHATRPRGVPNAVIVGKSLPELLEALAAMGRQRSPHRWLPVG